MPTKGSDAERRVAQWTGIFNLLYRGSDRKAPAEFNITGWQSVYGGDPIAPEAMAEWLEQTVERIWALGPRRVLEIGCGTGLVLRRLAPRCEAYWGLDIAQESIRLLKDLESDRIRLIQSRADQLDVPRGFFDTVVINSVIQYFPSAVYLEKVLRGAVELLEGKGAIFLGDIRHLGLLAPMQAEIALLQATDDVPTEKLAAIVQQKVAIERELLLSPRYFAQLKAIFPSITAVETRLKTGVTVNELNKYRYDVTLWLGRPPETEAPMVLTGSIESMATSLRREAPSLARIPGVANQALRGPLTALRLVGEHHTTGEARAQLAMEGAKVEMTPHAWVEWANQLGYRATLLWAPDADDGSFDVSLESEDRAPTIWEGPEPIPDTVPQTFANDPLSTSPRPR